MNDAERMRGGTTAAVTGVSEPAGAPCSASKGAMNAVARSMAVDLARYGIATDSVAPVWVRTPMTEPDLVDGGQTTIASMPS
jgi:NAD(P)-dependent dehydrogenase (short-subunit alcohol dehydrogenase family)